VEGSVPPPISGDNGYSCPDAIGAASYVGRLDFLALDLLCDGGGVESVSFVFARLDVIDLFSSVSEELPLYTREDFALDFDPLVRDIASLARTLFDPLGRAIDSFCRTEFDSLCRNNGSLGDEKRLADGTTTEGSAVDSGMCAELFEGCRLELPSEIGTPYRARGSPCADILGLMTVPFAGADEGE
jgi:hypothetical protein